MLFEHWIYSTAIAIIAGMIHFKKTGRDYSWIIIASAYAPDLDIIADRVFNKLGMPVFGIRHGDFHNIAMLLLFAGVVTLALQVIRYRYLEAFLFAGIGFAAHIFQDVLIFNPAYAVFWPLSDQKFGVGLVEYNLDWYHIADTRVLFAGLLGIVLFASIRAAYEGKSWIKKDIKKISIIFSIWILMIPALGAFDISFIDTLLKTKNGVLLEDWQFTQNTSWDPNIFHSGDHSGRISIMGNESKISGIWRSTFIPVKPNSTYLFSAWGRTENANGTNTPGIRIVELDSNNKWIKQTDIKYNKGTNEWTQKNISFVTRSNTRQVYVYVNIWKGYGTFWFDDVELYEEGKFTNLIPDPGIEKGYEVKIVPEFEKFLH